MKVQRSLAAAAVAGITLLVAACGGTESLGRGGSGTVTVYSADGLGAWYFSQFYKFTKLTGIEVNLVEAGSGEVVSRVEREQSNPQADLLVTVPPFIQKAEQSGLLQTVGIDTSGIEASLIDPGGLSVPIVENALSFIANPEANPQPTSWNDLLKPQFKGKVQYSTPGQAGDGTAVLVLLQHLMGKRGALDYLAKLQVNNVGPASSTGGLQPKVSNGDLLVANGDVQMNLGSLRNYGSKFNIFFPAMPDHSRTTVSLPYVAGLTKGAPQRDGARKLLAFLISDDVQTTVGPEAFGIPVKESIAKSSRLTDPKGPTALLSGAQIWVPDWTAVLSELDADIAAYQKAISS
ncbi:MAG: 2-aminoethylphosphonate ABC transporter substrate-binding protein [Mycobacterium sp.]|nr:2-aminoethylphosphonate ABC transporter substrate-binding protein [Mycobacterium sp.]